MLLSAFDRQCQIAPDTVALVEGQQRLSYGQLRKRAASLSKALVKDRKNCRRVAIALDRGIDACIALFSVLGAGACYVPLDMKNPAARLRYIIDDVDPQWVIGLGSCPDWIDETELWLDIERIEESGENVPTWPISVDPENLAAILYTSGSTGRPKGVALSHRALHNFAAWATAMFCINTRDRVASLTPFHFDLSIFDLFGSLTCGAAVYFVPAALTLSPSRLSNWLGEHQISVFYTVPSLLSFLALKGALETTPLPSLTTILFAGEVFPTEQLKRLGELLPDIDLYNLYGPTETNVCCYWPVDRGRLTDGQPIPIGRPACNAVLKIDADTGELLVQSANNLSGYWQQGRLVNALTDEGFYATGDRVAMNQRGELLFHGRLDRMLKCSGYRVEPAEIERAILQHPEVLACAVVGIADKTSGQRPAAVVVLKAGAKIENVVLAVKLRLPFYMHPVKWAVLAKLPLLSNGKTDYQLVQQQLEKH